MRKIYSLLIVMSLFALCVDAQGIYQLAGMTKQAGSDNLGTMFSTNGDGTNYKIRHNFSVINPGSQPQINTLTAFNGKFYGVATSGGEHGSGLIFEWDPSSNIYNRKFTFGGANGSGPMGALILHNNKFYGATQYGGNENAGILYEWDPQSGIFTKKFEFSFVDDNGYWPTCNIAINNGKIYGATAQGGANDKGVIFQFDLATNTYSKKIEFNGSNGREPFGSLSYFGNKFYGMTVSGGANDKGILFEWDPVTNAFTKRVDFNGTNGANPYGSLTALNGKLYGVTQRGNANDQGVIFEWNPNTNVYTKKFNFSAGSGSGPSCTFIAKDGKFYGMTGRGGSNDAGVIFEWNPANNNYAVAFEFSQVNGINPNGSLALANGKFYGMTPLGGNNDDGVIFEYDATANVYTKKIDFNDKSNGIHPTANLVSKDGKWYGVTHEGGVADGGVIFEWDPATDVYTKKIDFNQANGTRPFGALTLNNGKFYGMTSQGGSNDYGVIFEWDPATNIYSKKFDLTPEDGGKPYGALTFYNGKFYGMAYEGGEIGAGVIFEWNPATNVFTRKIDFTGVNGVRPTGDLLVLDGKLYGMTYKGGSNNAGTIFAWDPASNNFTKKYDLSPGNGSLPAGSLSAHNGKLYATTSAGGSNNWGVIFEFDPTTNVYTKRFDFTSNPDGNRSFGNLTFSDGKFYGTTRYGGSNFQGVFFEWNPATNVYIKKQDLAGNAGGSFPGVVNSIARLAAPVAKGNANSCTSFAPVTIDQTNNNVWVAIVDERGDAVAEVNANGNNLGIVTASMFIKDAQVREDANKRLYLHRNITLTPAVQPSSPVSIRLYLKQSEFSALKDAFNSAGQSANINTINDLGIYRNGDSCSAVVVRSTTPLLTTAQRWEADYVLTGSTSSLGSFYFFSTAQGGPLPITSLDLSGKLTGDNGELQWTTTGEFKTASFDLERSTNGTAYTKISNTAAINLPGEHKYTYTDKGIATFNVQNVYYRLKQLDIDGKFSYSNVVVLDVRKETTIALFPNPVAQLANVSIASAKAEIIRVRLMDNAGKVIRTQDWKLNAGNNTMTVDVSGFANGIYHLQLSGQTVSANKTFVKR